MWNSNLMFLERTLQHIHYTTALLTANERESEITAKLVKPAWKHSSNLLSDAEWNHQSIGFRHNPLLHPVSLTCSSWFNEKLQIIPSPQHNERGSSTKQTLKYPHKSYWVVRIPGSYVSQKYTPFYCLFVANDNNVQKLISNNNHRFINGLFLNALFCV